MTPGSSPACNQGRYHARNRPRPIVPAEEGFDETPRDATGAGRSSRSPWAGPPGSTTGDDAASRADLREALLDRLAIGLRTFYRELDLLKRCGIKVRREGKTYGLRSTVAEAEARLPFPDPQLSFAEMAELARTPATPPEDSPRSTRASSSRPRPSPRSAGRRRPTVKRPGRRMPDRTDDTIPTTPPGGPPRFRLR